LVSLRRVSAGICYPRSGWQVITRILFIVMPFRKLIMVWAFKILLSQPIHSLKYIKYWINCSVPWWATKLVLLLRLKSRISKLFNANPAKDGQRIDWLHYHWYILSTIVMSIHQKELYIAFNPLYIQSNTFVF